MAEFLKVLSNDAQGHNDVKLYFVHGASGNITADTTAPVFIAPVAGRIVNVVGNLTVNGEDGVNPFSLAFDVKKNGTSVAATLPAIAKAAGSGQKDTFAAGTGITQAVLKTDGSEIVAAGDAITVVYDITRTTPGVEAAGPSVLVVFEPYAG